MFYLFSLQILMVVKVIYAHYGVIYVTILLHPIKSSMLY